MTCVTSLGVSLAALGVSAALHAAALLAPMGHPGPPQGIGKPVTAEESVDLIDPIEPTPEAAEPVAPPPADRPPGWSANTHPSPVPFEHHAISHEPNLEHRAASVATSAHAPATTAAADAPRFTIATAEASVAYGVVSPGGAAPPHEADVEAAPVPEQSVDGKARLVRGVSPVYPDVARTEGIEGDVRLELVVGLAGVVESVRLVQGVGGGLVEAAVHAVRQYRFAPATQAGRPVRVRMGWSVQFRLR